MGDLDHAIHRESEHQYAEELLHLAKTVFALPVRTVVHHIHEICVKGDEVKRVVQISYLHQPVLQGVPLDKISITVSRTNEGFKLHVSTQCTSIVQGVRTSFDDVLLSLDYLITGDGGVRVHQSSAFAQYLLSFPRIMLKSVLRKIEPNFDMDSDKFTQNV